MKTWPLDLNAECGFRISEFTRYDGLVKRTFPPLLAGGDEEEGGRYSFPLY